MPRRGQSDRFAARLIWKIEKDQVVGGVVQRFDRDVAIRRDVNSHTV